MYVHNHVQRIRQSTHPGQWRHVPTENNPTYHATRPVLAGQLQSTNWLTGPSFLLKHETSPSNDSSFELINPTADVELRPEVTALATKVSERRLNTKRFDRFSSWHVLTKAVMRLRHIAQAFKKLLHDLNCVGWHYCKSLTYTELTKAEHIILKRVQEEAYAEETGCIQAKRDLPLCSPLAKLQPFVDGNGLLWVGGRIKHSNLGTDETHPILIPGKHHVAMFLIRHHHERIEHQGRHITEGAICTSGLWIVGAKSAITNFIYKCVMCRKLRGKVDQQQMSDLPPERLQQEPPFGLDVFGPWEVVTRRTRGGSSNSKRWAILFTCMSTRAIHVELIESMSTSSCINALRRFFSIRGPVKQLRSNPWHQFYWCIQGLEACT